MYKYFFSIIILFLAACNKDGINQVGDPAAIKNPFEPTTPLVPTTVKNPFSTPPATLLSMSYPKDANGFYLVPIDTTMSYSRFNIYVEATKPKPEYRYNGVSVIVANFDCNSYWIITNSFVVNIPLYNPFTSLSSSPYFTTRIAVKDTSVILSQFKNYIVPIVQTTGIYLKDYFAGNLSQPADEYKPTDPTTMSWSKRIIGPVPKFYKGDTIKVYCNVSWDLGQYSIDYPLLSNKLDSINIIFK